MPSKITEIRNLAKDIIEQGGDIAPLLIPSEATDRWALTNPSVIVLENEVLVNIRAVEYTLIHSDKNQKYWSLWGPLSYCHSESLSALRTINYLGKLNKETLEVEKFAKIDTSKLDTPPVWTFHGLEDVRLAKWNDKLYGIGVRRDVKPNGEGRMQFQEIEYSFDGVPYAKEISRNRIQPPFDAETYCEKNWMPVHELPYTFIKWTNPTEIVEADLSTNKTKQLLHGGKHIPLKHDLRGGSQVIRWGDGWLTVIHETHFEDGSNEFGLKDAYYFSRFVYWNDKWEIVKTSEDFSFIDTRIEFVTGMDHLDENNVIITFGAADSGAFVIKIPKTFINNFLTKSW